MIHKDIKLKKKSRVTPNMLPNHPLFAIYSLMDELNSELDNINKTYNHRLHGLPVPSRIIEIHQELSKLQEQTMAILYNDNIWELYENFRD